MYLSMILIAKLGEGLRGCTCEQRTTIVREIYANSACIVIVKVR